MQNSVQWFDTLEQRNEFMHGIQSELFELQEADDSATDYLKLLDVIDSRTQLSVYSRLDSGKLVYGYVTLKPHTKYMVPENEVLLQSLITKEVKKTYSSTLEERLKATNTPYELRKCSSCGGKVQKIVYKPVERVTTEATTTKKTKTRTKKATTETEVSANE